MNRRGFFGAIAALFATSFIPTRPKTGWVQMMRDGENVWFLIPKNTDNLMTRRCEDRVFRFRMRSIVETP